MVARASMPPLLRTGRAHAGELPADPDLPAWRPRLAARAARRWARYSAALGVRHPRRRGEALPYECGFEAFEDTRMKFDVRYYLVAILFIIFDLEIAFLFPWAVALGSIGVVRASSPWACFSFILVVGFVYEWKKGALEWD